MIPMFVDGSSLLRSCCFPMGISVDGSGDQDGTIPMESP
ncbi:hypothetical protein CPCC7001_1949 [Cyanobium sp. PCC 7001]|nr:hypothetical protein CPCC7001_1949 [Cyanobium sp. PCC 7001]